MTVQEEVRQRIERDALLAKLRKKIESGKGTYADTAAYSVRAGKLLGEVFSRRLPEIPLEEREQLCVDLLHDQYIDINVAVDTVQRFRDEALGIHIAPQHAPFDEERASQIGSSLRDLSKPVETLQRRSRAATETATKAIHDDRMKTEAKFRHRAGLDCRITRVAVNGCCPWCSNVAGRYVYGEEPDDIYRRHDNCDCTVTFENGRKRQDVWSKREWEAPEPGAGAGERVVLTKEQAKALLDEKKLKVFDFQSKPGKNDSAIADLDYINSDAFSQKFKGKYENQSVEDAVVAACRQIIKNRNGTSFEEAFFIDAHTGKTFSYVKGKKENGVDMPESLKNSLTSRRKSSIIMIHNHPNSSPLSSNDYATSSEYASLFEVIACGHNGDVYVFRDTFGTAGDIITYADGSKEYEGVRDFRISVSKYKNRLMLEDYEARHNAWSTVSELRGFFYEKR